VAIEASNDGSTRTKPRMAKTMTPAPPSASLNQPFELVCASSPGTLE
jgi:hypothetical protein